MKFTASTDIDRLSNTDDVKRYVSIALDNISQVLNNGIFFADNFNAKLLTITFAAANTEQVVMHGLGRTPLGYFSVGQTAALTIYDGSSENTSSLLYLKASATGTCRLWVY